MTAADKRQGPGLLIAVLVIVVLALVAFIALRANGGRPGDKPATRSLPQGAPGGR